MNIDAQVKDMLAEAKVNSHVIDLLLNSFYLQPSSFSADSFPYSTCFLPPKRWLVGHAWGSIDALIMDADLAICLTSKWQYIRECKKYYECRSTTNKVL